MGRGGCGSKAVAGSLAPTATPYVASSGAQPWGIALSPENPPLNLYTFNSGGNSVGQYALTDGIPAAMAPATITAGGSGRNPRYGFVTPNGKFVVATNFSNLEIAVFPRNVSSGALSTATYKPCASQPYGICMAVNTAGTKYHVYVGHGTGSIVSQFEMDPDTGVLTALSTATVAAGLSVQDLTVSPDGLNLYAANSGSATLSIYDRDAAGGGLTPKSTATASTGSGPSRVNVSPDNKHVYVACNNAAALYQFLRDQVTNIGALSALSPASITGFGQINGPYGMAITPSGNYVYMPSSDNNTILQLSRNSTDGKLTKLLPVNVHASLLATGVTSSLAGPYNITVSPDNKFAYCTMAGSGTGSQGVVTFNIRQ